MAVKTRAELIADYGDAAFDFGQPGDALVRDVVDSVAFGWTQIGATVNASGTEVIFSGIPQSYGDLLIDMRGVSHSSVSSINIGMTLSADGVSFSASQNITAGIAASITHYCGMLISAYAVNGVSKYTIRGNPNATSGATASTYILWNHTAPISAFRIFVGDGAFDAGTIALYAR